MVVSVQGRRRVTGRWRQHLYGRRCARGHGPTHHHLGVAGSVPADADQPHRSRTSPGCDEMGSGEDDGAAVRPQRCGRRVDAGVATRAGGNRGGADPPAGARFRRSLVPFRRWLHLRVENCFCSKRIQRTTGPRRLYLGWIRAVRAHLRRQRGCPRDRRQGGQDMTAPTLDVPVKAAAVQSISLSRRIKNKIAETFFLVSFGIGLVPLIWVLWVVVERGGYAITRPGWWTHSLRGVLPEQFS